MGRPMGHIRILMSSRVLLDLEDADKVFKEKGLEAYRNYMQPKPGTKAFDPDVVGRRFDPGPLFDFAKAALKLNEEAGYPVVEIGLSCKDEVDTAKIIFRNIDVAGLGDLGLRIATAGRPLDEAHHNAFGTDLFLSHNEEDVKLATNMGKAAATIYLPPGNFDYKRKNGPIHIAVDGDAVAFGSSAEVRYRKSGLTKYANLEFRDFDEPLEPGPFSEILAKISQLNKQFPRGEQPFDITLVTARGGKAGARALAICEKLGIEFNDGCFFLAGADKVNVLKAINPDVFFDDQVVHLQETSQYIPTGLVHYPEGSAMHKYTQEQEKQAAKSEEKPKGRKRSGGAPKP